MFASVRRASRKLCESANERLYVQKTITCGFRALEVEQVQNAAWNPLREISVRGRIVYRSEHMMRYPRDIFKLAGSDSNHRDWNLKAWKKVEFRIVVSGLSFEHVWRNMRPPVHRSACPSQHRHAAYCRTGGCIEADSIQSRVI